MEDAKTRLTQRNCAHDMSASMGPKRPHGVSSVYNFAAGPTMMPHQVLARARDELLNWHGTGMSVWELPFTGAPFRHLAAVARQRLRELLDVPENYRILFMHGGASAQFSLVPLNLARDAPVDYVETGHWARKAIREGRRYAHVNVVASNAGQGFTCMPAPETWQLTKGAAYCHVTTNETANGLQFHHTLDAGSTPLVADATSDFLARPLDVGKFGLVYAGAQKNIGPAGLTIVIVHRDLLGAARAETPTVLNYQVQADSDCMVNTPLTYAIYLAGLVFAWLAEQGGVTAMATINRRKSARLYAAIDSTAFYQCPNAPADRSHMNVCFGLADQQLEGRFLAEAETEGLCNLKGHTAVGGIRASLYNAMPEAGVKALMDFMVEFERRYG